MSGTEEKAAPLLSIRNVYKSFGLNEVLKGIDMDVMHGEVLALIGGNGAGKSTLMKIIMGIYTHDKGELLFHGEEIVQTRGTAAALAKGIYMVPQEPLLFPNMTVEENILIGFTQSKAELHKELVETMEEIGWNLDLSRKASSLSIAEQQLVEILRGILRHAQLLILDEPTVGLDVIARDEMLEMLRDFMEGEEGRSILISSHISGDLETLCDDIYMIHQGKIVLHEDTDVLLGSYALLKVNPGQYAKLDQRYILRRRRESFGYSCLTDQKRYYMENYPKLTIEKSSIDNVITMMIRGAAL